MLFNNGIYKDLLQKLENLFEFSILQQPSRLCTNIRSAKMLMKLKIY